MFTMRVMKTTFWGGAPPVGEVSGGSVGGAGFSGARTLGYSVVSVGV